MSRITTLTLAGLAAVVAAAGSVPAAQAAPLPALTGAQVGGAGTTVDQVGWRRGYGYGYRRGGIGVGGALAAGAAIGLLGGAAIAASGPRYGYGYGGYGYGGYARPAYGYPAYGYGYPAYGYGYPAYGW